MNKNYVLAEDLPVNIVYDYIYSYLIKYTTIKKNLYSEICRVLVSTYFTSDDGIWQIHKLKGNIHENIANINLEEDTTRKFYKASRDIPRFMGSTTLQCSNTQHEVQLWDTTVKCINHPDTYNELGVYQVIYNTLDFKPEALDALTPCTEFARLNKITYDWASHLRNRQCTGMSSMDRKTRMLDMWYDRKQAKTKIRLFNFKQDLEIPLKWKLCKRVLDIFNNIVAKPFREYMYTIPGRGSIKTQVVPMPNFQGIVERFKDSDRNYLVKIFVPFSWYKTVYKAGLPSIVNNNLILTCLAKLAKNKFVVVCSKEISRGKMLTSLGILEQGIGNKWHLTHTPNRTSYLSYNLDYSTAKMLKEV